MSNIADFRFSVISIWFRLATLRALVFTEALMLAPGKAQGWSYYLTPLELWFEVLVRLVAAALAGMTLGTISTAMIAPFLWFVPSWCYCVVDSSVKFAVVLVLFLVSRYALEILIKWSCSIGTHRGIYDKALLVAQFLAFAIALYCPRSRQAIVTSLDGFLDEKTEYPERAVALRQSIQTRFPELVRNSS